MGYILVIDDEPGIRTTIKDILEDESYKVLVAEDGPIGLEILKVESVDTVILDVWLPRMGGIDVLKAIKTSWPAIEVIIISGHASIDMAVQALKLGAFDFIEKPLSIDKLFTAVRNARTLVDLRKENTRLRLATTQSDTLLGNSPEMESVRNLLDQAAKSTARVLITGENGTGKELAARRIHELSDRSNKPFVAVNCAAIPDTLIESELFGHEKGSFTDASSRRKGKFEVAHTGTLFLDEIADMSPQAQAKVLRAIQDMRFERIGGEESIDVDVRIIAATNKELKSEIAAARFREDLFFRLNVIPVHMPPLRDRPGDVADFAQIFLAKLCGKSLRSFSPAALETLKAYAWPGNVRELKNFIERVSVMSDEKEISSATVGTYLNSTTGQAPDLRLAELDCFQLLATMRINEAKDAFERKFLIHNLRKYGYNVSKTAEAIGVYPSNLHAKIKKFGIEVGE